jgi:hypothetical protein
VVFDVLFPLGVCVVVISSRMTPLDVNGSPVQGFVSSSCSVVTAL